MLLAMTATPLDLTAGGVWAPPSSPGGGGASGGGGGADPPSSASGSAAATATATAAVAAAASAAAAARDARERFVVVHGRVVDRARWPARARARTVTVVSERWW